MATSQMVAMKKKKKPDKRTGGKGAGYPFI